MYTPINETFGLLDALLVALIAIVIVFFVLTVIIVLNEFQWVSCSPNFRRPLHLAGGDGITGTVQKSPAHLAPQPLKVPLLNFPISPPSPSAKLPPEPSSKCPSYHMVRLLHIHP